MPWLQQRRPTVDLKELVEDFERPIMIVKENVAPVKALAWRDDKRIRLLDIGDLRGGNWSISCWVDETFEEKCVLQMSRFAVSASERLGNVVLAP